MEKGRIEATKGAIYHWHIKYTSDIPGPETTHPLKIGIPKRKRANHKFSGAVLVAGRVCTATWVIQSYSKATFYQKQLFFGTWGQGKGV